MNVNILVWILMLLFGSVFSVSETDILQKDPVGWTQGSATEFAASTPEPETELSMRLQLIDEARQNPASGMEAEILEDGLVTAEEYELAVEAFRGCMQSHGFNVALESDPHIPGLYIYMSELPTEVDGPVSPTGTPSWGSVSSESSAGMPAEDDRFLEAFDDCSEGTIRVIEAVYLLQIINPNDDNIFDLTVACLEENEMIVRGVLTGDLLERELQSESPQLPFDLWDETVISCFANPAQTGITDDPGVPITPETASVPESGPMSRAETVEAEQESPDSELEERILQDGVVTAEEYQEAVDAYLMCML